MSGPALSVERVGQVTLWLVAGLVAGMLIGAPTLDADAQRSELHAPDRAPRVSTTMWRPGERVELRHADFELGGVSLWVGDRHVQGLRRPCGSCLAFTVPAGLEPGDIEARVLHPSGAWLPSVRARVEADGALQVRAIAPTPAPGESSD